MKNKTCGNCQNYKDGWCIYSDDPFEVEKDSIYCADEFFKPKPSPTIFDTIIQSEEALAPKFVYFAMADEYGRDYWGSSLIDGKFWKTEKEAITATVARLKEVDK